MGTVDSIFVTRGICLFVTSSDVVIVALIADFVAIELRCSIVMLAVLTGILDIITNKLYLVSSGSSGITISCGLVICASVCHHVDHTESESDFVEHFVFVKFCF